MALQSDCLISSTRFQTGTNGSPTETRILLGYPEEVSSTTFTLYTIEPSGLSSHVIWFNLNGRGLTPNYGDYKYMISISSEDTPEEIADRVRTSGLTARFITSRSGRVVKLISNSFREGGGSVPLSSSLEVNHLPFLVSNGVDSLSGQFTVTPSLDILNKKGSYFTLSSVADNYVFYYAIDALGENPVNVLQELSGFTSVKIDLLSTDTIENVRIKTRDTIDALGAFNASILSTEVVIDVVAQGKVLTEAEDGENLSTGFRNISNIQVSSSSTQEEFSITVLGLPNPGSYFKFSPRTSTGVQDVYLWFMIDGQGVDPSTFLSGITGTGVQVPLLSTDTPNTIASAINASMVTNLGSLVSTNVLNEVVTVTNVVGGESLDVKDGEVFGSSYYTLSQIQTGEDAISEVSNLKLDYLNSRYFKIHGTNTELSFWFNLDAGGTAPETSGSPLEVAITTGDTPADVAENLRAVINSLPSFTATRGVNVGIDDHIVYVQGVKLGDSLDFRDGLDYKATGFTISSVDGTETTGEQTIIECSFSQLSDISDKYLTGYIAPDNYHVWINYDSAGVEPSVSNSIGLQVDVDSNTDLASALATEVSGLSGFSAIASDNTLTITNSEFGHVMDISDGSLEIGPYTSIISQGAQGEKEISEIVCPEVNSLIINGKFVEISSPTTDYYLWFNVLQGSQDPALVTDPVQGLPATGIQVDYYVNDTAQEVASAINSALNSSGNYESFLLDDIIQVSNLVPGDVPNSVDTQGSVSKIETYQNGTLGSPASIDFSLPFLSGEYLSIYTENSAKYVWFNNGSSSNPRSDTENGIEVTYSDSDTLDTIAGSLASVVNLDAGFSASSSSNVVTITNAYAGRVSEFHDAYDNNIEVKTLVYGTEETASNLSFLVGRNSLTSEYKHNLIIRNSDDPLFNYPLYLDIKETSTIAINNLVDEPLGETLLDFAFDLTISNAVDSIKIGSNTDFDTAASFSGNLEVYVVTESGACSSYVFSEGDLSGRSLSDLIPELLSEGVHRVRLVQTKTQLEASRRDVIYIAGVDSSGNLVTSEFLEGSVENEVDTFTTPLTTLIELKVGNKVDYNIKGDKSTITDESLEFTGGTSSIRSQGVWDIDTDYSTTSELRNYVVNSPTGDSDEEFYVKFVDPRPVVDTEQSVSVFSGNSGSIYITGDNFKDGCSIVGLPSYIQTTSVEYINSSRIKWNFTTTRHHTREDVSCYVKNPDIRSKKSAVAVIFDLKIAVPIVDLGQVYPTDPSVHQANPQAGESGVIEVTGEFFNNDISNYSIYGSTSNITTTSLTVLNQDANGVGDTLRWEFTSDHFASLVPRADLQVETLENTRSVNSFSVELTTPAPYVNPGQLLIVYPNIVGNQVVDITGMHFSKDDAANTSVAEGLAGSSSDLTTVSVAIIDDTTLRWTLEVTDSGVDYKDRSFEVSNLYGTSVNEFNLLVAQAPDINSGQVIQGTSNGVVTATLTGQNLFNANHPALVQVEVEEDSGYFIEDLPFSGAIDGTSVDVDLITDQGEAYLDLDADLHLKNPIGSSVETFHLTLRPRPVIDGYTSPGVTSGEYASFTINGHNFRDNTTSLINFPPDFTNININVINSYMITVSATVATQTTRTLVTGLKLSHSIGGESVESFDIYMELPRPVVNSSQVFDTIQAGTQGASIDIQGSFYEADLANLSISGEFDPKITNESFQILNVVGGVGDTLRWTFDTEDTVHLNNRYLNVRSSLSGSSNTSFTLKFTEPAPKVNIDQSFLVEYSGTPTIVVEGDHFEYGTVTIVAVTDFAHIDDASQDFTISPDGSQISWTLAPDSTAVMDKEFYIQNEFGSSSTFKVSAYSKAVVTASQVFTADSSLGSHQIVVNGQYFLGDTTSPVQGTTTLIGDLTDMTNIVYTVDPTGNTLTVDFDYPTNKTLERSFTVDNGLGESVNSFDLKLHAQPVVTGSYLVPTAEDYVLTIKGSNFGSGLSLLNLDANFTVVSGISYINSTTAQVTLSHAENLTGTPIVYNGVQISNLYSATPSSAFDLSAVSPRPVVTSPQVITEVFSLENRDRLITVNTFDTYGRITGTDVSFINDREPEPSYIVINGKFPLVELDNYDFPSINNLTRTTLEGAKDNYSYITHPFEVVTSDADYAYAIRVKLSAIGVGSNTDLSQSLKLEDSYFESEDSFDLNIEIGDPEIKAVTFKHKEGDTSTYEVSTINFKDFVTTVEVSGDIADFEIINVSYSSVTEKISLEIKNNDIGDKIESLLRFITDRGNPLNVVTISYRRNPVVDTGQSFSVVTTDDKYFEYIVQGDFRKTEGLKVSKADLSTPIRFIPPSGKQGLFKGSLRWYAYSDYASSILDASPEYDVEQIDDNNLLVRFIPTTSSATNLELRLDSDFGESVESYLLTFGYPMTVDDANFLLFKGKEADITITGKNIPQDAIFSKVSGEDLSFSSSNIKSFRIKTSVVTATDFQSSTESEYRLYSPSLDAYSNSFKFDLIYLEDDINFSEKNKAYFQSLGLVPINTIASRKIPYAAHRYEKDKREEIYSMLLDKNLVGAYEELSWVYYNKTMELKIREFIINLPLGDVSLSNKVKSALITRLDGDSINFYERYIRPVSSSMVSYEFVDDTIYLNDPNYKLITNCIPLKYKTVANGDLQIIVKTADLSNELNSTILANIFLEFDGGTKLEFSNVNLDVDVTTTFKNATPIPIIGTHSSDMFIPEYVSQGEFSYSFRKSLSTIFDSHTLTDNHLEFTVTDAANFSTNKVKYTEFPTWMSLAPPELDLRTNSNYYRTMQDVVRGEAQVILTTYGTDLVTGYSTDLDKFTVKYKNGRQTQIGSSVSVNVPNNPGKEYKIIVEGVPNYKTIYAFDHRSIGDTAVPRNFSFVFGTFYVNYSINGGSTVGYPIYHSRNSSTWLTELINTDSYSELSQGDVVSVSAQFRGRSDLTAHSYTVSVFYKEYSLAYTFY